MIGAGRRDPAGSGPLIAVVDYGAGNLVSIDQAFESVGSRVTLVRSAESAGRTIVVMQNRRAHPAVRAMRSGVACS